MNMITMLSTVPVFDEQTAQKLHIYFIFLFFPITALQFMNYYINGTSTLLHYWQVIMVLTLLHLKWSKLLCYWQVLYHWPL